MTTRCIRKRYSHRLSCDDETFGMQQQQQAIQEHPTARIYRALADVDGLDDVTRDLLVLLLREPGRRLSQVDIQAELQSSDEPVRIRLSALKRVGAVECRRNRGGRAGQQPMLYCIMPDRAERVIAMARAGELNGMVAREKAMQPARRKRVDDEPPKLPVSLPPLPAVGERMRGALQRDDGYKEAFAYVLRRTRQWRGHTCASLARELPHVHPNKIYYYENGHGVPFTDTLEDLCAALDVVPIEFLVSVLHVYQPATQEPSRAGVPDWEQRTWWVALLTFLGQPHGVIPYPAWCCGSHLDCQCTKEGCGCVCSGCPCSRVTATPEGR